MFMNYLYKTVSPVGELTLSSDGKNLTGLWLAGQKYFAAPSGEYKELPVFELARKWLESYFFGSEPDIKIPLAPEGSDFRKAVWNRLLEIPYGKSTTYGDIAKKLGASARAVGGAVGHNPISIIIPCLRVLGAGGKLTGYAGGLENKVKLLGIEGIILSN